MYTDENINKADIIKNIKDNDLDASNSRTADDRIIEIDDFISIHFMDDSNNIVKTFKVVLSNENNRFSANEKVWGEALDYSQSNRNLSKFSLSFYSEYDGSCTLTTRIHYEVKEKSIDSFEKEINELKNVMSSLNPQNSETKMIK